MTEKILQKSSRSLKIGVALTVFFSILVGLLNVGVLYLFGLPFIGILLGVLFIWRSEAPRKIKIFWTFFPVPLILTTFYLLFQLNKAESETFLIPAERRGAIVVFFDEKCGQNPVYENGRRIYKIPQNGILITKFKKPRGFLDQKFYLVDDNGNRKGINYYHFGDFETEKRNRQLHSIRDEPFTEDTVGAFFGYNSSAFLLSKNAIVHHISSYRGFERPPKERFMEDQEFSRTAKYLLEQCR